MFFWNLLIPIILLVAGMFLKKHSPKEISGSLGYRTNRSTKNLDTWRFAQHYCGELWWKLGWVALILSLLVQIPWVDNPYFGGIGALLCTVQCLLLAVSIFLTESALKKTFADDGTRREPPIGKA